MTRATDDILGELHGAMAKEMKRKLEAGEVTASDLNVIRQFLKDNGINADPADDPNLNGLADELPEDIDNVHPMYGG